MSQTERNRQAAKVVQPLKEVALLFLRMGATAFGGPAAYIAIMQREAVRQRKWVDNQQFLDMVGAVNLIPGPNATEMANYLGSVRAGWRGLITAGVLFTVPGMLATMVLAWAYVKYGSFPQIGWVLYGVKPVVIAIIIQALWDLGRKAVKGPLTGIVGAGVLSLYFLGFNEIALLFGGAAIVLLFHGGWRMIKKQAPPFSALLPLAGIVSPVLAVAAVPFSQVTLFLSFLKIGAVLYGSGYVLLAFLNSEFVERLGWLTKQQLIDSIAAGQLTPGPLFTSSTFIGYVTGGWAGSILATIGIFLPAFLFVGLLGWALPWFQKSPWARVFLDGVNISAVGLMAAVTWQLGIASVIDIFTIVLLVAAIVLVFRYKVNSAWLILGGAAAGIAYKLLLK